MDEATEFADSSVFLVESDERFALAQLGSGNFRVTRVLLDGCIIGLDGGLVIALAIGDLSEIKLCIAGEIVLGIVAKNITEFPAGHVIPCGVVVAKSTLVEIADRRRLRRCLLRRSCAHLLRRRAIGCSVGRRDPRLLLG